MLFCTFWISNHVIILPIKSMIEKLNDRLEEFQTLDNSTLYPALLESSLCTYLIGNHLLGCLDVHSKSVPLPLGWPCPSQVLAQTCSGHILLVCSSEVSTLVQSHSALPSKDRFATQISSVNISEPVSLEKAMTKMASSQVCARAPQGQCPLCLCNPLKSA